MTHSIPLSVLDLAPIGEGSSASQALANTLDLAKLSESLGYKRYWLAEHHNMTGIASAATAVVIGAVAGATETIRAGAGGVMLPNHSPLVIAEQFGTLEALHPGRIDLGLGRAPGGDRAVMRALRRGLENQDEGFPRDVMELLAYLGEAQPGQSVQAVPGAGSHVPVWILGSSLFGAQLAAALGLPYAFASHFAPGALSQAVEIYRARFEPSDYLAEPYVMLGCNVVAADDEAQARRLFTSLQQAFLNLRRGRPGRLPRPVDHVSMSPSEKDMLDQALACTAVGGPDQVTAQIRAFAEETGADELILTAQIHDHAARRRSFEIAAQTFA